MAGMTFLQLVQQLRQECGVPGTGPATCQGQTGEMRRLVDWVAQSYQELQERHEDWSWLLADFTFQTTAQKQTYTPAEAGVTDLGVWDRASFRAYTTANNFADEQLIIPVEYPVFRNQYQYGNMRFTYARPMSFAVEPGTKNLLLGPIPDATGWTVLGKYYRAPMVLVNDTDIPAMPPRFHMIIVYSAMIKYGYFEAAGEVLTRGQAEYNRMLAALEIDQIQGFGFGAPLA